MFENILDFCDANDLRIVRSESMTDDNGARWVCVYSIEKDALTFVSASKEARLLEAGVEVIDSLPDD